MSNDVTQVLIDMVKEVQRDIKDIKEHQSEASISISTIEAMQEATNKLKLDERLRQVELKQSQDKGGVSLITWLIPTVLAVASLVVAIMKH
jgi:hypothetical protein